MWPAHMSLDPKAGPKQWDDKAREEDRNPDHRPSSGAIFTYEDGSGDIWYIIQVRGEGMLVFRSTGSTLFRGVSLLTREEIGYYRE